MRRIFIPGIVAGFGMLLTGIVVSFLFNALFPALQHEYQNPQLFRPWSDPLMSLFYLHPFVLGVLLSFTWSFVRVLVHGTNAFDRGTKFGFLFWLVASIPGMFISYSSFPVSFLMIAAWTLSGLIQLIVAGLILAKLNA